MSNDHELHLILRTQKLTQDEGGHSVWEVTEEPATLAAAETAILLCDVWDTHPSRGAAERVEAMAPRMDEVVRAARAQGISIIHAPSGCMDFYEGTPARQRIMDAPQVAPPAELEHDDPPLPFEDHGTDTGEPNLERNYIRQNSVIQIADEDGISDDGGEVYNFFSQHGINNMILIGVHTNVCILRRTFAIKQMVRWGVNVMLVRDLTDAMYDPAQPPYVSHDEGTQLVIGYIEKFWCPTITSDELLATL